MGEAHGGAIAETIERVSQALDAAPLDAALHARMLAAMRAINDVAGSTAHQLALAAFEMLDTASIEQQALILYNVATVYVMRGRSEAAIRWYQHALNVDPKLAIAHQNLAVALDGQGRRQEATFHRTRAYQLQRVFTETALGHEQHRVLILGVGKGTGNVPVDALLPRQTTTRIHYVIDYADEMEDAALPPYDLVFNAIGDPDIASPLAARLACFVALCGRPVLNLPEAIGRTHRHKTAALLANVEDVVVPRCIRVDVCPASGDELGNQIADSGAAFPLLMRPLGTHGGEKVELHDSPVTLLPVLAELHAPCYLTTYHDFGSADGYYRKYRIIYIDREPYPYHLAISSRWMVHYFSAGMIEEPWKLEEERHFLDAPFEVLGERASAAIRAIGRQLDLDYCGIEFTLTPDGRVLVFEANATMLTHREAQVGPLAHKNLYIDRIIDAFEQMLQARAIPTLLSSRPA